MTKAQFSISYNDLEVRYGSEEAYRILLTVERLAKTVTWITNAISSREERLQRALAYIETADLALLG